MQSCIDYGSRQSRVVSGVGIPVWSRDRSQGLCSAHVPCKFSRTRTSLGGRILLPGSLVPVLSSIFRLNMLLNTGTKHVKFENVWSNIQDGMKRLFVANKPHFAAWLWIYDEDNGQALRPRLPLRL